MTATARSALQYERFIGRSNRNLATSCLDFVAIADSERVIDVGCGTGSLTSLWRPARLFVGLTPWTSRTSVFHQQWNASAIRECISTASTRLLSWQTAISATISFLCAQDIHKNSEVAAAVCQDAASSTVEKDAGAV